MSNDHAPDARDDCACLQGDFNFRNFQRTYLGGGVGHEVEILTCNKCGRHWLSLSDEPDIHDDAGMWYRGLISPEDIPSISQGDVVENALRYLSSLDWYYCGGLYWSDRGIQTPFKSSGTIRLLS